MQTYSLPPQIAQVHLCAQCWHYTQTSSLRSPPVCVLFMLIYFIFMSQFIIGDNFCCSDSKTAPCLRNLGTFMRSFWLWPGVVIPQFHYKQHHQERLCCFFPTFTWLCKVNLTSRVKLWTRKFSGLQCVISRIRFLGLIKLNVSWIPENVKGAALTYFRTSRVLCRGSCASRQNRDFLKSRPKETSGKGEWTDLNNTWFWNFWGCTFLITPCKWSCPWANRCNKLWQFNTLHHTSV